MDDRTAAVPFRAARRRGATALAALLLGAGALTACGSAGSTTASDSSSAGAASSGAASPGGTSPSAAASPPASASAPVSTPPADPTAEPSAASPTGPGIAVGEHDPTAPKYPALGYRIDGASTLVVSFYGGTCDKYGLKAEEATPGVIRVRVVIAQPAPKGQACAALVKVNEVSATLAQPFHGEAVLDLATGEQVQPGGQPAGGPR
ncbi:hypothetical protein [Kitasatospora sp. MBT63]|uniref:hypothetical protein n=1 Tax=Kitasatospora sp. MBT63 TaxID=1444768 RepID=UPI0011EA67BD|nr:hypothetical protein [Kitasatospora sp. MBT63]